VGHRRRRLAGSANNGTVKVDGTPFDDLPNNEPHVGCVFQIDFYGYDAGQLFASASFELDPPTGSMIPLLSKSGIFIGEDSVGPGGPAAFVITYRAENGRTPYSYSRACV
jgi:hypothetical protein